MRNVKNLNETKTNHVDGYFVNDEKGIRFIKTGEFDSQALYELIRRAAGEISDLQFENLCGISHPNLFDVKSGRRKSPLPYEQIENVAKYAAEGSGVTLEDLAFANDTVLYTGSPDSDEMRRLVDLARGDEAYHSFLERIGIKGSSLRDKHRVKKKPYDIGTVLAIARNASPTSGVTLKKLLRANYGGKPIPKRDYAEPTHKGMSREGMRSAVEARIAQANLKSISVPVPKTEARPAFTETSVLALMTAARRMSETEFESLKRNFARVVEDGSLMSVLSASDESSEPHSVELTGKEAMGIAEVLIRRKIG